jgi:hypothetical protein
VEWVYCHDTGKQEVMVRKMQKRNSHSEHIYTYLVGTGVGFELGLKVGFRVGEGVGLLS